MCVASNIASGDPPRLSRPARQPPIERHAAFCDYKWLPGDDPFVERFVKPRALFRQNPIPHSDACVSQFDDTSAGVPRVYVSRADNYVFNTGADYRICAGGSASRGRARLQRDIQRGARWHGRTEIAQTLNLSVIAPRFPMVSFRYYSIVDDQHRSYSWIWARQAVRLFRLV
jgi:hypothetical protein